MAAGEFDRTITITSIAKVIMSGLKKSFTVQASSQSHSSMAEESQIPLLLLALPAG